MLQSYQNTIINMYNIIIIIALMQQNYYIENVIQ